MRFGRFCLSFVLSVAARELFAQNSVPTLTQPIPAQGVPVAVRSVTIDLRNHFGLPGLAGSQFATFDTVLGRFSVELRNDAAPRHAENFLTYARAGDYNNSFIHRTATVDANSAPGIIQGGGYKLPLVTTITRRPPVPLEYNLPNARGTLAAARTSDINSATSEWYFNVRDNSTSLGPANGGGYSVFGRVLGTGMTVVDAMAAVPRYAFASPFGEIPLRNYTSGDPTVAHVLLINSVNAATLYPTGSGASVLSFSVQNSAPSAVQAEVSGSTLTLTAAGPGTASITVRASDVNNNQAESTFTATVSGSAPVFTVPLASQTVAAGSTVVLTCSATGAASFRWERNGVELPGASSSSLVINNVSAANAGSYVAVATNVLGSTRSNAATLTVSTLSPTSVGRLVNLSILTSAGAGAKVLTMGAFIGGNGTTGALPLVIRAVGPTLSQPPFNVSGVLPDPTMSFFAAGSTTPIETNDNWGGGAALVDAFRSVAAFDLPTASLDSAIVRTSPGAAVGGYTIQVSGKGEASGAVIAEVYDASGNARTATTPRLINLSTRAQIDNGADLAVGFVLGGQSSRTVLVRGVGPSLAQFGLTGTMVDPRLELFSGGQSISGNDDWAGSAEIATAAESVGAFSMMSSTSKDAALLVTLPPGAYTARISGANGVGGVAIVEVYEVP
jgi:cyclophilin family peptidyl-prolyl cis-trans isomerase